MGADDAMNTDPLAGLGVFLEVESPPKAGQELNIGLISFDATGSQIGFRLFLGSLPFRCPEPFLPRLDGTRFK